MKPWRQRLVGDVCSYPWLGVTSYQWGWHVRLFGGWLSVLFRGTGPSQSGRRWCAWHRDREG